jgi:hypothetical protein
MTAPKMIWAWEYQGQHGKEGQWRGSAMSAITGSARYIRADAPELVALVEALRFADETFRDLGWHSKWEFTSAALAAYEALK